MLQVWEVVAQLIGLGLSIALLNGIEATGDPTNAVWAWVVIQSVHVVLRFKSLSMVQLPSLNQKRSCVLINAFLEGQQLPGKVAVVPALLGTGSAVVSVLLRIVFAVVSVLLTIIPGHENVARIFLPGDDAVLFVAASTTADAAYC